MSKLKITTEELMKKYKNDKISYDTFEKAMMIKRQQGDF